MPNFYETDEEMWERHEDEEINSLPDTICPVCDGINLHPKMKCPDCGYSELFEQ